MRPDTHRTQRIQQPAGYFFYQSRVGKGHHAGGGDTGCVAITTGLSRQIRGQSGVTCKPFRCRCQAQLAPTIPAPITTQCFFISAQHIQSIDQRFKNRNDLIQCPYRASTIPIRDGARQAAMQLRGTRQIQTRAVQIPQTSALAVHGGERIDQETVITRRLQQLVQMLIQPEKILKVIVCSFDLRAASSLKAWR